MTIRDVVAVVLLGLAVVGVLAACIGAVRSGTALEGQHFVSAAGTVPPILLAAAVVVREGAANASVLAILTAAVLVAMGAGATAAFARAATGQEGPEQSEQSVDQ
ncbi:MAG TPA: hypothetical protein VFJ19_13550 [Nocardioidaceae bacterium]|nr:hypothetical protein [Nocardioidaceae bacterium]